VTAKIHPVKRQPVKQEPGLYWI